jgi:lipopolysaccharide export system protein LptC
MASDLALASRRGRIADAAPRRAVVPPNLRYTRFVAWMKLLLPLVAIGLLMLVVAWPQIQSSMDKLHLMMPRIDAREARDLRMVNPRYTGVDKENRPYVVTADVARQTPNKDDLVALEVPKADIVMQNGAWVAVTSDTGLYQSQTQLLDLYGQVHLFHDRGMTFSTESARLELDRSIAEGGQPVSGHGPSGEIQSEGFRLLERGEVVIFTGKARALLNSTGGQEEAQ